MNKNLKLKTALAGVLFVLTASAPIHSGADPDLPDEAFTQNIAANDPFPHQLELAARVNFWRHVFGVWGNRQVALHDMSNPGLVYEVLTLPEGTRGADRKEFINEHVEDLMRRLYTLEQKVAIGNDLDDAEQALLNKFRTLGKISQLAGSHERVRIQYGIRDKFLRGVELSGRYDNIFRRIFRSYGVPEDLAFLPHVESSFQAHARSGAGAVGIWQFTLPAARTFMKVNSAVDERYDPVLAAEGCARYLAYAYEKLGDWGLAITSYNHGVGGMSRAQSEFGNDFSRILEEYEGPQFGFDSRNFYVEFLAAREVARHAERYFDKVYRERPQNWEKVALEESMPIYKVARDYGVNLSELSEINSALTNNALKGRVALPEGTSIWLPAGTKQRLASRSQDEIEEASVDRQIRVVRTPDPTQGRVVAMVDDALPTDTKIDSPIISRRFAAKQDNDDEDLNAKIEITKINNAKPNKAAIIKIKEVKEDSEKPKAPIKEKLIATSTKNSTKHEEKLVVKVEEKITPKVTAKNTVIAKNSQTKIANNKLATVNNIERKIETKNKANSKNEKVANDLVKKETNLVKSNIKVVAMNKNSLPPTNNKPSLNQVQSNAVNKLAIAKLVTNVAVTTNKAANDKNTKKSESVKVVAKPSAAENSRSSTTTNKVNNKLVITAKNNARKG